MEDKKLKQTFTENMRRFGTKNLKENYYYENKNGNGYISAEDAIADLRKANENGDDGAYIGIAKEFLNYLFNDNSKKRAKDDHDFWFAVNRTNTHLIKQAISELEMDSSNMLARKTIIDEISDFWNFIS